MRLTPSRLTYTGRKSGIEWLAVASCILLVGCSAGETELSTGCADVVEVVVTGDGMLADGTPTYRFDVTVSSADTGWDKYADRWEVVDAAGAVLGERVLAHPHVDEQPFTRSQTAIAVPGFEVTVRAHDSVEGFCGETKTVSLA